MNLPEASNTMTGGAAIAACSGGSVRGRCRSQTLSCASIAKLDGSPSFHFSGTFGQAGIDLEGRAGSDPAALGRTGPKERAVPRHRDREK